MQLTAFWYLDEELGKVSVQQVVKRMGQAVRECAQCEKHGLSNQSSNLSADFTERFARILLDRMHARKTGR
jgi:hypothetical protein